MVARARARSPAAGPWTGEGRMTFTSCPGFFSNQTEITVGEPMR